MFFRYSVTSPHPTTKPSWGWLRVGVRKPRLVFAEIRATWNKVTATPRSYCRGCVLPDYQITVLPKGTQLSEQHIAGLSQIDCDAAHHRRWQRDLLSIRPSPSPLILDACTVLPTIGAISWSKVMSHDAGHTQKLSSFL